jgi:polysaccharide biosynthesis transport protein
MARPNAGDQPSSTPLSPYHTPAAGMPVPPAGPYGPTNTFLGPLPPKAKSGPTPASVLYALKRRWVMATFIGGLVAVVAAVGVWAVLPAGKHTARSSVELRAAGPEIGTRTGEDFETFRKNQMFLLKTRDLINRTLADPSVGSLDMVKNADDPVRMLEEGIKVDAAVAPNILTVSLTGDNPDDLKQIISVLVKKYIDDATAHERRSRDERLRKLESLAEKIKGEIQSKERSIRLMVEANSAIGGEGAGAKHARMQQELAKLDADVFASQKEVQELEVTIGLLQKKLEAIRTDPKRIDLNPLELAQVVDLDLRVSEHIKQRVAKSLLLARELQKTDNPEAPTIVALQGEIDRLDKDIDTARKLVEPEVRAAMERANEQQIRNKVADLLEQLNVDRARLASRTDYRDKFQKGIAQAVKGDFDASTLLKELEPQREALNKLQSQMVNVQVEKNMDDRVTVREEAVVIMNQNLKQKTTVAIAAGVASFFGVLVLVGFLEWRTRRIDGVDQVVTELSMRVIGTVPAFPNKANLKAAELAGNANWRFVLNESINSTRTMLLHTARHQSMQVVMVTSATQGEGKTSLTSQLASSMATAGMRTLIVDCDLRNPSIHKLFDLNASVGVSEVLCQEADVADAVQPTAVPNLWIIPAGQCSTRVITALAQGHPLETLFNRLRGQFDFIIVDSCPVLPVADALLIGQHVDGVVFSIMQDISQLPKVLVASEKLAQLNIPLVGAVVNGIRQDTYSYGYNYVKQLPA